MMDLNKAKEIRKEVTRDPWFDYPKGDAEEVMDWLISEVERLKEENEEHKVRWIVARRQVGQVLPMDKECRQCYKDMMKMMDEVQERNFSDSSEASTGK